MNASQMYLLTFDQPLTDFDILRVTVPGEFFTRKMVADRLGRAKSPTLVTRLERMAAEGIYKRQYHALPNQVDMIIYSYTEDGVAAWKEAGNGFQETDGEAVGL